MEQLEQRKKYWNELRASSDDRFNVYPSSQKVSQGLLSTSNAASADPKACSSRSTTPPIDVSKKDKKSVDIMVDAVESLEEQDATLSSSYDESNIFRRPPNGYREVMDKDSYNFYEATDGQQLILHPLNMKCLLHYYGSYEMLPNRISGRILQLETVTQSEALRRRYRYLSHFSLTTTFQLCEIDVSAILPPEALSPFMDEIKKREKQRKQLANKFCFLLLCKLLQHKFRFPEQIYLNLRSSCWFL